MITKKLYDNMKKRLYVVQLNEYLSSMLTKVCTRKSNFEYCKVKMLIDEEFIYIRWSWYLLLWFTWKTGQFNPIYISRMVVIFNDFDFILKNGNSTIGLAICTPKPHEIIISIQHYVNLFSHVKWPRQTHTQ